jgi:exosome complex RNA-binding protein Rrp42 (RNase PH superfamily)
MVGAELLPLSNPDFESGPPGIQAVELARVVDRGIRESKCLDFKKLCIKQGEKAWIILIDIVTLNDAGNLFDASSNHITQEIKNSLAKLDINSLTPLEALNTLQELKNKLDQ